MLYRNASKFAIFYVYENPGSFFRFSFQAFLSFTYPMNALVYVNIYQDIYIIKLKNVQNEKKNYMNFLIPT